MNYANYMGQNPYNMYQPQQSYFANAMQQTYSNQQQMPSQQNTQNQQTITTQPPIMQPQSMVSQMKQVLNIEEATGAPVDLINGTPSFFFNKSNGDIYLKQFDVPSGTAIFKTYIEAQPQIDETKNGKTTYNYEKEFNYLIQGVDNLHRMVAQLQEKQQYPLNIKEVNTDVIDIDPEQVEEKSYKNKKRGQ